MSKFQELLKKKAAGGGVSSDSSGPAQKSNFQQLLEKKANEPASPTLPPFPASPPQSPSPVAPRRPLFTFWGWLLASGLCVLVIVRVYLMLTLHPAQPAQRLVGVDWKPVIAKGGELFPSYIIAISTLEDFAKEKLILNHPASQNALGDPWGLVGVQVSSPEDNAQLTVTVAPNLVMNGCTDEVMLPKKNTKYVFYPRISYNYQALLKLQEQPVTVDLKLQLNGQDLAEKPTIIPFASINDCPYMMNNERSDDHWTPWMYAAYVDENNHSFDKFYREAFDSKIVDLLDGYQEDNDAAKVRNEVFAVWYTFQKHGFKYSDVTTTSAINDFVSSQRIRFVDQSLSVSQANCADGSILFASMLRRIGLHTELILVPGHMFLGVFLNANDDDKSKMYLETTMLGSTDLSTIASNDSGSPQDNPQVQASQKSFMKAVAYAAEEYRSTEIISEIKVEHARDFGIKPISPTP